MSGYTKTLAKANYCLDMIQRDADQVNVVDTRDEDQHIIYYIASSSHQNNVSDIDRTIKGKSQMTKDHPCANNGVTNESKCIGDSIPTLHIDHCNQLSGSNKDRDGNNIALDSSQKSESEGNNYNRENTYTDDTDDENVWTPTHNDNSDLINGEEMLSDCEEVTEDTSV